MPKKKHHRKPPARRAQTDGRRAPYVVIVECDDPRCTATHTPLTPPPGWDLLW